MAEKTENQKPENRARSGRRVRSVTPQKLHLLVTIVNRSKADFFMDLLESFDINLQLYAPASGTANTEIINLLGLTDNSKAAIFSVIRDDRIKATLAMLDEKFHTVRDGKGIAYAVPLTGVIGVAAYQFLSNNRMTKEG